MKTALVHDWLTGMRGGEKCLEVLCELFPDADIFTLVHTPGKVSAIIEDARKQGKIIAGGQPHEGKGFFINPTIVSGLPDSARLVCEEQFGPVMPLLKYDTIDEAIERANTSEYGLGGTVWSKSTERAVEVAKRMNTGTVWINKHLDLPPSVPYGGVKQSGFGVELGQQGLEEFTQMRILNVAK